jgi:hypothetical protein
VVVEEAQAPQELLPEALASPDHHLRPHLEQAVFLLVVVAQAERLAALLAALVAAAQEAHQTLL